MDFISSDRFDIFFIKMLDTLEDMLGHYGRKDCLDIMSKYSANSGYPMYTDVIKVEQFNKIIVEGNKKIIPTKDLELLMVLLSNLNIFTPGFTGNPFDTPLLTMSEFTSRLGYASIEDVTPEYLLNI